MTDIEPNALAFRSVDRNHEGESAGLDKRYVVEGEGPHRSDVGAVWQTVRPANGERVAERTLLEHRLPIFVLEINRQSNALVGVRPRDPEPKTNAQAVMPRG